MLFLMTCAIAVLLRHRFTASHKAPVETTTGDESV
jgi:hypothetical protein